jgi:Chitobiase/beta-hexosaminidase C-terminal domain/PASTA domain
MVEGVQSGRSGGGPRRNLVDRRWRGAAVLALGIALLAGLVYVEIARAAITVTPASNGTGISVDTAADAATPAYATLGNVVLAEGANGDFAAGANQKLELQPPAGWEFNAGAGSTSHTSGRNISASSISVTSSLATVTVSVGGTNKLDTLTISGLQVRPTTGVGCSANPCFSGNITRTGSGTDTFASSVGTGTNFGSLSAIPGTANKLGLSGASSSTAGQNSASITAAIQDQFGNATTRGSNTVITPSSSSTSGTKAFKTTGGATQATFTITAGSSTVSFLYYDETAGSYSITLANDASLTNPAGYGFTVNAAAATKLTLSGATSSTAGQNSASITATLRDQFDNPATRGSNTVITPASTSSSGTKAFKTTGGTTQATFTITAGSSTVSFLYYDETAGSYSITLSNDASLTNPAAYGFTVNPAGATKLALSGPSTVTAGQNSGLFTATIQDQFGNTTTRGSDTVLTPASSSGSGSKAFKTAGGTTQATFTIGAGSSTVQFRYYDEAAGGYSITLSNDASLANPAGHAITVDPDAATKLGLSGPGSVTAGQNSTAFTATLRDQFDNAATRGSNTIITPASSSTSGTKTFKTTGGATQATFTITAGSSSVQFLYYDETAGSYTITLANDASLTNPAGHAITVDAAAATKIGLSGPSSVTAGQNSTLFTATLRDQFDNPATRGSNTVITPSSSSTSGTKVFKTTGGATQATFTITAGSSTVQFLYYDETAGGYTITLANDASLTNPAGHAITVDPAAAAKIALSGPSSVTAGQNSALFTATIQDQFGNTTTRGSDTVVTPASSSGSGSKAFKTAGGATQATFTIGSGTSTVTFRYYDETAGSYTITLANDASLTNPAGHAITVDAAAASKLALSGPGSVTAGQNSALFTATLQDPYGNAATRGSDTVVTPASSSGSGSKAFKTAGGTTQATFTIMAGSSTVSFRYYDETAGGYTITLANDAFLTNPAGHAITVDPAAATKLALTGPSTVTAGQDSASITATLRDQFDNPATRGSNTVVTPSSSSTSGTKVFKTTGGATQATFTITGGSSTVQFRYYDETAGGYTITLSNDASLTNPADYGFTVDPAAATKLALTGPSAVTAGQNSGLFTATIQDQFGNTTTRGTDTVLTPASSSGSGSKAFKNTGGTTQATFTITAGSSTVQFRYYDETAGGYTITLANDASLTNPAAHAITVDAAAATKIGLSGPSAVTAGQNSTAFTATLRDQFDNPATRGSDTVVTPSSSSTSGLFKTAGGTTQATFTISTGSSTVTFLYYDETAGSYTITLANDASLSNPAGHAITVDPAAAAKLALSGPGSVTAGQNSALFTATIQDQFGNTTTRGSDTVVTPASSSGSSSKAFKTAGGTTQATFTIGSGTSTVSFRYYDETAGSYTITLANDASLTNPAGHAITVDAAAASKIVLSGATSTVAGEDSGLLTATLQDAFANTATRGSDTVVTPSSSSSSGTKAFKTAGGSTQATFTIGAGSSTVQFRYYDGTGGSYDLGLTDDASLTDPPAYAFHVYAAHGSGSLTATPTAVSASQTGRTITFTYTADPGGTSDGAVRVSVPSGWSLPSTTASAAGYTSASAGTVGVSGQDITVTGVTLAGGATLTVTYGDTGGGGPGATIGATTGSQTLQGAERSTAAGTITDLGASPSITIYAADGTGTITVSPESVFASSTANALTFTYTAAAGGMSSGELRIAVPATWPTPSLTSTDQGYTTSDVGTVSVSGQTIVVSGVTRGPGQTVHVTYGAGPGATAPATPEAVVWTATQKSVAAGALTALATSPTVTVDAADGAGSIAVAPDKVSAGSGQTLTFTYTAGGAGMTNGAITIAVPAGWSAPDGVSASTGTPSFAAGTISVTGVTLAGGATMTIAYEDGTATATPGGQTWTVKQKGTSGGTLTDLASGSPAVTVYAADGTGSILSDPTYVVNGSTGDTIELTYTAAALAGGMGGGKVEVTVPGNWGAPNPVDVVASTGTVGVSGNVITVTGVTLAQGADLTITYSNVTAPTTGGAQTWTTRQASTAAGALTGIASPSIVVSSAPDVPALVSPGSGATVTATPTLTATFADTDAANTGTLTFQVCDDAACTSVVDQLDSASWLANGADGSVGPAGLTEAATYHWRARATDSDNVSSAYSATRSFTVDGTGPTIASVDVTEGSGDSHSSGSTLFYRPGGAGGTFSVAVDASDATGVDHVTFPGLAGGFTPTSSFDDDTAPYARTYTWHTGDSESGSKSVTAVDVLGNPSNATFTVTPDSTAPAGGSISVPAYSASTTVTITSANFADAGSGIGTNVITRSVADLSGPGSCGSYSGSTTVSSPDTVPTDGKCYRYTLTGTDNVGNTATVTDEVLVDTTAPSAPALTLSESVAGLHADGTTLWFNGSAANGDFTVAAAASDAQSGIAKVGFPALGGVAGGGDDTVSPYSADYSWTGGAPGTQADNDVVAHNNAAGTAASPFDLTEDSAAPAGGSISVPTYSSSTTVTITSAGYTDAGSGIAANTITRSNSQDPTAPGTCPAGGYTGATAVTSPDTVPTDGKCYRYTLTGTDNVGNTAAVAATVLVDTTAPAQPSLSLSTGSTGVYADNAASPKTIWFKPGTASGDFTVNAATSDDESGVEHVQFAALAGLTGDGGDTTEPYQRTYSWTSAPSPGAGSVSALNNAGLESAARTLALTADATAPAGGSISVPAYSSSTTITVTSSGYTDAGSGIAANTITRSDAQDPAGPGTCPAGGYTGATAVTSPDTVPTDGKCYRYTLTGTDNVGNTAAVTATVLVDTTPPTGPGLTLSSGSAGVHVDDPTRTVWFKPGTATGSFTVTATTSDAQSEIDKVSFAAIAGLDTGGGDVNPPGPFGMAYSWTSAPASSAGNAVTAFNRAGGTSANTFDLTSDGAPPSGGSIGYPDGVQSDGAPDVTVTLPADAESGLATVVLQQRFWGADCAAPGSPVDLQTVSANGTYNVILDQGFGCYTFQLLARDKVGNESTVTSASVYQLSGGSSLEVVELTSGANQHFAGGNLYFNTALATDGTFRINLAAAVEPDVDSVDFPSVGVTGLSGDALSDSSAPFESDEYTWTNAFTSSGTIAVTLHLSAGAGGGTRTELIQPLVDTTAPSVSDDTGSIGNDWKNGAQTVTLTAGDGGGSGVGAVHYTTDGSSPTTGSPSATSIPLNASGVYTIAYLAVDNVGNTSSAQTGSTQIRVDLDDPSNGLALAAVSPAGSAHLSGTDLWYRGGTAGSFALRDAVTDSHSGPASATFPAFAPADWTGKGAETITIPAGGPYESSVFTRTAAATGSFAYAVTGTDAADNGTSTTLTFREDSAAPSTGDDYASIGGAWHDDPQTLTLSPADGAGSGVGATYFSLDGGATWTQGTSVTLSATGTYNVTFYSVDNVGNAEAPRTVGPIRIDATAPGNSVVLFGASPSGSARLSGTTIFYRGAAPGSFRLRNTATDADSGPAGTTFAEVTAANWTPKSAETVSTPAGGPYESSAFGWSTGTADFTLTVTGLDDAGNGTDTALTLVDDSTPPDVSDDTASITDAWRSTNATVTLTGSDSGSGLAAVYYSLDGGSTWTQGTTVPLTTTGVHTIEYYAVDNLGNASAVETADNEIRIDKVDPSGAVTAPAAGAAVSGTTAQLSATASDAISGVASVQFQVRPDGSLGAFSNAGLPVATPPYDATWDTTTVVSGDYELRAFVTDLAGNTFATGTRTITVDNAPASGPADTVIPAGTLTDTILPVPGTLNTVTVPGGSNSETLVVRTEERIDLEDTPPAGSTFGGDVVEVRACVAHAGVSTASLDACFATGGTPLTQLPTPWKVSLLGNGLPASSQNGTGWTEITTEIANPADAAGHDESYLATGGGYDIYVKHLTFFTLLVPQEGAIGLSQPHLSGVIQYGLLKLRWTASGGTAPLRAYELIVDGTRVRDLGEQQTEEILGPFTAGDTRVFELRAVDIRGRVSPRSNAVTSVPSLIGLTVAEARAALAGRGFTAKLADPQAVDTDVVVRQSPAAPAMVAVGSAVELLTADAGAQGHAAFRIQVSNSPRITLGLRTLNVRVALTEPARVSARLFSKQRVVRTKAGRVVRWQASYEPRRVGAGATIVPFRLSRLARPGSYTLVVTARSTTSRAVTQSRTPLAVVRPAVRKIELTQSRFDVPLAAARRSVVTVELVGTGRLAAWRKVWPARRVEAGATILSLPVPRTLTKPGSYRLVVTSRAIATRKTTRTATPVKVVERSGERKPVDVVLLTGVDVTPETPLAPERGVVISPAEDADQVFTTASAPATNVQVIVIDVGGQSDVELIHELRLVYPDLEIVAVVPQGLGAAAREAGATVVVVKPAPPELISSLINRLATGG